MGVEGVGFYFSLMLVMFVASLHSITRVTLVTLFLFGYLQFLPLLLATLVACLDAFRI